MIFSELFRIHPYLNSKAIFLRNINIMLNPQVKGILRLNPLLNQYSKKNENFKLKLKIKQVKSPLQIGNFQISDTMRRRKFFYS